jgi:hypothetical protein
VVAHTDFEAREHAPRPTSRPAHSETCLLPLETPAILVDANEPPTDDEARMAIDRNVGQESPTQKIPEWLDGSLLVLVPAGRFLAGGDPSRMRVATNSSRVLLGGSWRHVTLDYFRCALRHHHYPKLRSDYDGFRLARTPG